MNMQVLRKFLISYKILFGLLALSSLIIEVVVLIQRGTFNAANFFSFFTVESNIFAALMLLVAAGYMIRKKESRIVDYLRGAATLFIAITGIIFSILLSGLDPTLLTAVPWDNLVLHYIIPVAVVVDWVLNPPQRALRFQTALIFLTYPILYLVYSLARGAAVSWYPYPFLNPANGGYNQVAIASLGVTVVVLILTALVVAVSSRRKN